MRVTLAGMLLGSVSLLLMTLVPPSAAQPAAPPSFAHCERLAARQPEAEETARCFDETGEALQQPEEAASRLRELVKRNPGSPWPILFLAYQDPGRSEDLFRQAVAGFAARREAKGEVLARANLYRLFYQAGRMDEAGGPAPRGPAGGEGGRRPGGAAPPPP